MKLVNSIDKIFLEKFGVDINLNPAHIKLGIRLLPSYKFSSTVSSVCFNFTIIFFIFFRGNIIFLIKNFLYQLT